MASFEGTLYRLTVAQYHLMADAGVFGVENRIELLEGQLFQKKKKPPAFTMCHSLLLMVLHPIIPAGWFLSAGTPMTMPSLDSEPEPDIQIVRGRPRDYLIIVHGADVAGLVVEVCVDSEPIDRGIKLPLYAAGLVHTFWLLDVARRRLEVYSDPTGPTGTPTYRTVTILGPDDEVAVTLDGVEVGRTAVRELLP